MLSHIQNQILTLFLRSNNGLRYSEARPEGIDNDLYNYHLKFLLEKKYVEKKDDKYFLTDFGKKYVQRIDVLGNFKEYFRFSVLPFTIRTNNGVREILMHRRGRHPYFGDVGASISGKVLYGEKVEAAASRKIKEETGLECNSYKFIGVVRSIRKDKDLKLIEDTLYHVCVGEEPSGKLIEKNEFGENFWASFKDALKYQSKNITFSKESEEVIKRIMQKDFNLFYFVEELIISKF